MKKVFLFLLFVSNIAVSQEFDQKNFLLKLSNNKNVGCLFYPNMLDSERNSILSIIDLKKYSYFNEGQNIIISMNPTIDQSIQELKKNQIEIYKNLSNPSNQIYQTNQGFSDVVLNKQLELLAKLTTLCK